MLLRFEVSNHRSIMDPVELSMIAVDTDRPAARSFDLLTEQVLTVAGIYGPNASGKSNILDSLSWLAMAAGRSLKSWDEFIPRVPFKFGEGPSSPSTFEVEMMVAGVRYAYRLEVNDLEVVFESLDAYPERRPRRLLERTGLELHLRRGLKAAAGARELLTPTTLALSAAMRFDDEQQIRPFGRQLSLIDTLGVPRRPRLLNRLSHPHYRTESVFDDSMVSRPVDGVRPTRRDLALTLLRFADLGIDDVQVVEERTTDAADPARFIDEPRRRLRMLHRAGSQQVPFELTEESEGTRTWFKLIGPVLQALSAGQTLLFDEIDASLHPRLSARLLELFKDPETNPRGAQLVFTTHDTSLLNHLNRDEVWLTEKTEGATSLTALAEYGGERVRRSLNLEKAYLQGRFGALPDLDQQTVRRALGLALGEA